MLKLYCTFIFALIICATALAQNTTVAYQSELKFYGYNIALNGLIGGIGAAINKDSDEKMLDNFGKGFLKGSVGGLIIGQGKNLAFNIHDKKQLWYSWASKLTHSVGTSIVNNTAQNKEIYNSFYYDYGFLRFEWKIVDKKFFLKLKPYSTFTFIYAFREGEFDIAKSLQIGVPFFHRRSQFIGNNFSIGSTYGSDISIYNFNKHKYVVLAHELIHVMQHEEHQNLHHIVFSNPVDNQLNKIRLYNRLEQNLNKYIYVDIPYFIVFRQIEFLNINCYYNNFYEYEAQYFANKFTKFECSPIQ